MGTCEMKRKNFCPTTWSKPVLKLTPLLIEGIPFLNNSTDDSSEHGFFCPQGDFVGGGRFYLACGGENLEYEQQCWCVIKYI